MIKEETRRIDCPLADFPDAYVIVPKHWKGKHCIKRDEALLAAKAYKSVEIANLSISLHLAESFGGIPGAEGDDPVKWDYPEIPLLIISWLSEVVVNDFTASYKVPKNS
jgi:hypothetical protein